MLLILVIEVELFEYHQSYNRVSSCREHLEGGVRCRLLLKFFVYLTYNKIVDLVYVSFIHIFLPNDITDGLINALLFEVGHICVSPGTLDSRAWDYFFHLCVGGGLRCLFRGGYMSYIAVGCAKLLLQILHRPGKLV